MDKQEYQYLYKLHRLKQRPVKPKTGDNTEHKTKALC